jgi:hypothetical protein
MLTGSLNRNRGARPIDASAYLTDRYSERKDDAEKLEQRVSLRSI